MITRFLGFDEAFSQSDLGKVISFKVNDRQFLEFIVDKQTKENERFLYLLKLTMCRNEVIPEVSGAKCTE